MVHARRRDPVYLTFNPVVLNEWMTDEEVGSIHRSIQAQFIGHDSCMREYI